jgi:hypothetical protein
MCTVGGTGALTGCTIAAFGMNGAYGVTVYNFHLYIGRAFKSSGVSVCAITPNSGDLTDCRSTGSGFSNPTATAFSADGFAYVVNYGGYVTRCAVAGNGTLTGCANAGSGFSGPTGIAISSAGFVYVANNSNSTISVCSTDAGTGALTGCTLTGSGFSRPQLISISGSRLYSSNTGGASVCDIEASGALTNCRVASSSGSYDALVFGAYGYTGGGDVRVCPVKSDGTFDTCVTAATVNSFGIVITNVAASTPTNQITTLPAGAANYAGAASSGNGTIYLVSVNNDGLLYSSDAGQTFTPVAGVPTTSWFGTAMDKDAETMFAVSSNGQIYRYTSAADTWVDLANGNATLNKDWRGIGTNIDGTQVVAAANGGGLWRSVNGGSTWAQITNATMSSIPWTGAALSTYGTIIVASAVSPGSGLYRSIDFGELCVSARLIAPAVPMHVVCVRMTHPLAQQYRYDVGFDHSRHQFELDSLQQRRCLCFWRQNLCSHLLGIRVGLVRLRRFV